MKRLILLGCSVVALAGCAASPPAPAVPVSVTVNGVSAPVDSIDTVAGVLHPPEDVSRVGWWDDSARPGSAGTAVFTGHVNLHGVDGFASRFAELRVGDEVFVNDIPYVVTEVSNYNKSSEFPVDRLNSLDGPEVLALITCGGEFIGPPFGYEDNVIAWAEGR